jgi:hypothetical protein
MSIFKDRVYEEMDDISRLIEPYQCGLNEDLSKFPDRLEIDPDQLESTWGTNVRDIVRRYAKSAELNALSENVWDLDPNFFQFEIVNSEGEQTDSLRYNFATKEIDGKIFLVKKMFCVEDDGVMNIIIKNVENKLSMYNRHADSKRINEIADLFNAEEVKQKRSASKKMRCLRNHIVGLIKSKKLDIRDAELAARFSNWIVLYANDGSLPALANITKLKIMTHQNKPIYSIDERSTV